jgi:hypothetical protein
MDQAMTYSIFDAGNLVVSFDQEEAAYDALERIARESAGAKDRLLLVAFDEHGNVVSDCAPGERITQPA